MNSFEDSQALTNLVDHFSLPIPNLISAYLLCFGSEGVKVLSLQIGISPEVSF
jgi:hypothetical protein